jgi:hypothetical protein
MWQYLNDIRTFWCLLVDCFGSEFILLIFDNPNICCHLDYFNRIDKGILCEWCSSKCRLSPVSMINRSVHMVWLCRSNAGLKCLLLCSVVYRNGQMKFGNNLDNNLDDSPVLISSMICNSSFVKFNISFCFIY